MILLIQSSIATFKPLEFHEGLNVLLADTSLGATDKQTRNSAGKTSTIEIIHFLLGADCNPDSLFRLDELKAHWFRGTFVIDGEKFTVERSGETPAKIFVLDGGRERNELTLKTDKTTGRLFISNVNWRTFLGHAMFGMPAELKGSAFEESYTPAFRSMISYFIRRRNSGAFIHPERHAEQQQRWDWQVNLSYLFGLDWKIPFEFQKVRIRERMLDELKKATKAGALGTVVGTVAELRPQVTVAETKAKKLRDQLANFEVLDSYRDLSARVAHAKSEMQLLAHESVSLQVTLSHLEYALAAETPPDQLDLKRMYSAAGIELPGITLRRFDEVSSFYSSVIENRKTHLQQEIIETKLKISKVEEKIGYLDTERQEILKTLEGRGALDDFLRLQRELAELEASAAVLRERFKAAEALEGETTQLSIDRANLKRRLQEDHQQREAILDETILIVADTITELYEDRTGGFVVEATDNGPEFRISIQGDRGGGISNMEIFCLDLALLNMTEIRKIGPRFLIHDSHLFDGVDERQIARAFGLGYRATENKSLQYIVTMNSDIFDKLPLPEWIDKAKIILKTRLSDETETGGLFGFRFN
jgi:uncharacterized protein YydD (DUF2326 family)